MQNTFLIFIYTYILTLLLLYTFEGFQRVIFQFLTPRMGGRDEEIRLFVYPFLLWIMIRLFESYLKVVMYFRRAVSSRLFNFLVPVCYLTINQVNFKFGGVQELQEYNNKIDQNFDKMKK
uniref:Uncharacterized protein n=1 Tax=Cacopsylla melanoneura TaxID=428564 RepID=A0A8D8WZV6_9HEMI